jgi:hypothetical protein
MERLLILVKGRPVELTIKILTQFVTTVDGYYTCLVGNYQAAFGGGSISNLLPPLPMPGAPPLRRHQ